MNLQKAPPRPPCGPRIYKKLYQYLDSSLPNTANTPTATPTKQQRTRDAFCTPTKLGGGGGVSNSPTKPAITPSRPLTGGLNFASIGKPQPALVKDGAAVNEEGVPGWIATTIRHVCNKLDVGAAIPHVYVGVATLLKSPSLSTIAIALPTKAAAAQTPKSGRNLLDAAVSSRVTAETANTVKIPALIIVVMLTVVKRMFPSNYNDRVDVMAIAHELIALGRVTSKRLREVMVECERLEEDEVEMERWLGMEWFGNVPVGEEGDGDGDVEMLDVKGREELDHGVIAAAGVGVSDMIIVKRATTATTTTPAKVPPIQPQPRPQSQPPPSAPQAPPTSAQPTTQPFPPPQHTQRKPRPKPHTLRNTDDIRPTGLGAIDWLSPARRADYKKWEVSILQRLAVLEGGGQNGTAVAVAVAARTTRLTPARVGVGRKRKADVLESPVV